MGGFLEFGRKLMGRAEDAESSGGSDLSEIKLKDGDIHFTDKPPAMKPEMQPKVAVDTTLPESGDVAISPQPKTGGQDSVITKPFQPVKQSMYPLKGDVFENSAGGKIKVEGVDANDEGIVLPFTEYNSQGVIIPGKKEQRKQLRNFNVTLGVKGMKKTDPLQEEHSKFYRAYEKEMLKTEDAFVREFEACRKMMDEWRDLIEEGYGSSFRSKAKSSKKRAVGLALLGDFQTVKTKIEAIGNEWKSLDDRFVENGRRKMQLLTNVRALTEISKGEPAEALAGMSTGISSGVSEEITQLKELIPLDLLQLKRELVEASEQKEGAEEPRIEKLERVYRKIAYRKTVKLLSEIDKRLKSKYDHALAGKGIAFVGDKVAVAEFKEKATALLTSINEQSSPEVTEKVFAELNKLEQQMFVERDSRGNTRRNGKNGEEQGGFVKGRKRVVSSDEQVNGASTTKGAEYNKKGGGVKGRWVAGNTQMRGAFSSAEYGKGEESQPVASAPATGNEKTKAASNEKPTEKEVLETDEIETLVKNLGWLLETKVQSIYAKIQSLPLDTMPKQAGFYRMKGESRIFLYWDEVLASFAEQEGFTVKDEKKSEEEVRRTWFDEQPALVKEAVQKKWLDINYGIESEYLGKTFLIALEQVKKYWLGKISHASLVELKDMGRTLDIGKKTQHGNRQRTWRFFVEESEDAILAGGDEARLLKYVLRDGMAQRARVPKDSEYPSFGDSFRDQLRPAIEKANREIFAVWNKRHPELGGGNGKERDQRKRKSAEKTVAEVQAAVFASLDLFLPQAVSLVNKRLQEKGTSLIVLVGKDPERIEEKDLERVERLLGFIHKGVLKILDEQSKEAGLSEDQKQIVAKAVPEFAKVRLKLELKRVVGLLTYKQ